MTIFSILSYIFQLVGLTRAAEAMWAKHEVKVKAQNVANAPRTDADWTEAGKKNDL